VRLVVVLVSVAAVATIVYVLLTAWLAARARRGGPWRAETVARADGSLAVVLVRDDDPHVRTVRELPRDLESIELAAELRLAREDAELQADELNR
jgi:hypothetical protein